MSNLTKTLAVVSLLAPMSAQPLGIGDIELHSALNQNLNAEIRLHLAAGENPADVSVRLAPPEKFDQAGVAWNYFLSKIKLEPVIQPNGSIIVKVTSREALTEPFLDFLLEVSWPQGNLFREFTLLIDPPAEYNQPVIPTVTADSSIYRAEPLETFDRPVRKARPSRKRVAHIEPTSNISPQSPSSGEYGPTHTADTLWRIAEKLGKERGVSTKQMMDALFRANPEAFNQNNIDALKTGMVLRIPETEAILGQAASQQRGEKKPPRKETETAQAAKTAEPGKALELVAPVESKIADTATASGPGKPGQPGAETAAPVSGEGTSTASKDLETQARLEKLEQQLNMMQQLLALKDQQLAALQNQDAATAQQAAQQAQALTPPQPTTGEQPAPTQPTQPTTPEPAVQPPVAQQPPVTQPAPAPAKTEAPKPAPAVSTEEEGGLLSSPSYYLTVGGLGAGILGLLGWLWWRKRTIEQETNNESMFASASQIKMPDSDSTLSVPVMELGSASSYDVGTVGESSFISDFTPSDFDAFDTDQNEVDPLSEADVYLAYGRYQQAEDLIRNAIEEQPGRDEYKLKLLEIFYANENKDGFTAYAQQLADAGKQTDRTFWNKVADMAKEIIPESALFGGAAASTTQVATNVSSQAAAEQPKTAPATSESLNDLFAIDDFPAADDLTATDTSAVEMPSIDDEIAISPEPQPADSEKPAQDDNSLDFDLSAFTDSSSSKPIAPQAEAEAGIESIDFDLSGFSLDDSGAPEETAPKTDATSIDETLESFDFNFDLNTAETASETEITEPAANLNDSLDIESLENYEFPELETIAAEDKTDTAPTVSATLDSDTTDEFDFNFDFDAPIGKTGDHSGDDIDLGVADLTDMDEFETKIDLAKAYIDMGDADAAKNIAEEVLKNGNKEQQKAAQAILDELSE